MPLSTELGDSAIAADAGTRRPWRRRYRRLGPRPQMLRNSLANARKAKLATFLNRTNLESVPQRKLHRFRIPYAKSPGKADLVERRIVDDELLDRVAVHVADHLGEGSFLELDIAGGPSGGAG